MLTQEVRKNGLYGTFLTQAGPTPRKAIILVGGSEGGQYWMSQKPYLQNLVESGYSVLSLAYFNAPGLPRSLKQVPLEYFETAFNWLAEQENVLPDHYAIMGKSRGGELALLLASNFVCIKVVIAIVPSDVVFVGGIRSWLWPRQVSAWSYRGHPLPFVPIQISFTTLSKIFSGHRNQVFEIALQNHNRVKAARIPVEHIQGPVLLVSASQDQVWPSQYMCDQITRTLQEWNFKHRYEHIIIDSSHDVFGRKFSWDMILQFLNQNFSP